MSDNTTKNSIAIQQVLVKVSVSDVAVATNWYVRNLGFKVESTYSDTWARLSIQGTGTEYGLSKDGHTGDSGAQVTTFIVPDIAAARNQLIANGVDVGPIEDPGDGVQQAFFKDLNGNSLGIRQNSPN